MTAPNLFIVYVTDIERATNFYRDLFAAWTAKGVTVAEEPHDEIYGRTFAITDPDGNPICVTPVD